MGGFNATDPEGGEITYSLVDEEYNNRLFTLDANGTLRTAVTFDYETNATTYLIRVQAMDELNATVEGNFTVQVTDVYEFQNSPPKNLNSYGPLEITENEPIGSIVGYLQASDPDWDEIFFSFVDGEGDEGNELFVLTEDGELWSKNSLNYEKATSHSIRVQAVDFYGLAVEKSFVVKVKDVTIPMVETEIP